jgi:myxalamid-type polyketide synthase MxaE and MxaD
MANMTDESLSPLQRALLAIKELRARLEASERAKTEPIAVIGMGCRFPGGANNPDAFWQLLHNGTDAVTAVPADRWDGDALYDSDMLAAGKINTRQAAFLDRVDLFDADFFGISPREAAHMDPQQRLLLEVAYETLEDAGQPLERLAGSRTGVFVGIHSHSSDYTLLQVNDPARIDMHTSTGTAHSIVANRLSYVFDLQGPSLAVDTACSSSLVAVHLACQSLRDRDCELALVGGVNLILSPEITISLSKMQALSPDGRCKTFDAAADGFGRGEGCGAVVLKRLSDALAAGDPILAAIAGSAVNQDGTTNGLTAPNGLSQQDVIRRALAMAGVEPAQIGYVETHGTGTVLGDPIEVEALAEVVGQPRADGSVCALGSVKTNIGHLEGAAGIAGLIKVILSLRHQAIPRHLHFQKLNPHISLANTPFVIPTAERPWPAGAPRFAGISSFGFGGTNAHVIVGDAPATAATDGPQKTEDLAAYLLPLSARSEPALKELAAAYRDFFAAEDRSLADVCYTAGLRRSHHEHRLALVGGSPAAMLARLEAFDRGEAHADTVAGRQLPAARRGLAFVFSGQGAQLLGMGQELLATEPVFRAKVAEYDELLRPYTGWSLLTELTAAPEQSRLEENEVAQPALFAVQVALAALLRTWGIAPDTVIGHSVGEVAAAHVAGILSLADAIRVIYYRGRVIQKATGSGRMAAVGLSQAEAEALLAGYGGHVSLAAANSPVSSVLSGEPAALEEIVQRLQAEGRFGRLIPAVNYASHSHVMAPYSRELADSLAGLETRPANLPIYSTVTGAAGRRGEYDAAYWGRNLRQPVLFAPALAALAADGFTAFLEIGSHPLLTVPIGQCLEGAEDIAILSTLRRDQPERQSLLRALAGLYVQGYPVNWAEVNPQGSLTRLPAYPWQHRRYWVKPAAKNRATYAHPATHPLLGGRLRAPLPTFEVVLSVDALPYLGEHRFHDLIILPTTALVEMAWAAAGEALGNGPHILTDLSIREALILPDNGEQTGSQSGIGEITLQVVLTPEGSDSAAFQVFSQKDETGLEWTLHATGAVRRPATGLTGSPLSPVEIQGRCREVDVDEYYGQLAARGLSFGPTFRGVARLWRGEGEALGRIETAASIAAAGDPYIVHPAYLDACLQPLAAALPGDENYLLIGLEQIQIAARRLPEAIWSHARLRSDEATAETVVGDVYLYDEAGKPVGRIGGLLLKRAGRDSVGRLHQEAVTSDEWLYDVQWRLQPRVATLDEPKHTAEPGQWLIFANGDALAEPLAATLRAHGEETVLVTTGEDYRVENGDCIQVDPLRPEHFGRLFDDVLASKRPLRGVVYLSGEDMLADDTMPEVLTAVQQRVAGGALHLIQALARVRASGAPRLWLVTRGAQPIDGEPGSIAQSTLWGLGRVAALEFPELWGGLIDLAPGDAAESAARLFGELWSPDETGEDQIAWRADRRYVVRLTRGTEATADAASAQFAINSGAHLITGGLGGLGLKVAHWLAEQGAEHLVLTGRTGLPERSEWGELSAGAEAARRVAAVRAIEALGVTVTAATVDVANEAQMAALFGRFGQDLPPLRGVIHAAAALDVSPLAEMRLDNLLAMLRAKVAGAWMLHRLTRDMTLDYFVLFSSTTALWGVSGMAHYAAANCFLDSLAHYRRAHGLPALSVNWGLWEEARLFSDEEKAQVARFGLESMPADTALEALSHLLTAGAAQKVVAAVDWAALKSSYEARRRRPFLSQVDAPTRKATTPRAQPAESRVLAQQAEALPPGERRDFFLSYIRRQVARVMGHNEPQALDTQRGLFEIGMDSLMAVELKNRLETDAGRRLPAGLIFNYPNIKALATYLERELVGETVVVEAPITPPSNGREADVSPELEPVTEEELLALFDNELAAIEDMDL